MAVPVLYPSPQFEFESPTPPAIVKTPPATTLKPLFVSTDQVTFLDKRVNASWCKVQYGLSPEPESSPHNLASNQATSPRHVKAQPRQSSESPLEVLSPQGARVGYSFDSSEPELSGVHQSRPWWQLLWALCSVVFITVFIPMGVFLMPFTRAGRPPPTFSAIVGVATVSNATSSPLTMSQTTAGLPRVTYDPDEGFLLEPGETVGNFCKRHLAPDPSPKPPTTPLPTRMLLNSSSDDIQLRPVICVFDAKYWRLDETYLPTLIPLQYCSAIAVHGYAVNVANVAVVWKYPTAKRYLDALATLKSTRQLLHRSNSIKVYFTLGGAREDSANLSLAAEQDLVRLQLARAVSRELQDTTKPWGGVNVEWNYPGDPCNRATNTSGLFLRLIHELKSLHSVDVMISVSPVKSRMSGYSLELAAKLCDYVIIKTHTHTAPPSLRRVVRCSGDQSVAADVFNEALKLPLSPIDKSRLGYSISVAPETFMAPAAELGAPVLGSIHWDNHTRQPGRTSYASVCLERPVIRSRSHPQCLIVARQYGSQNVGVATFADEQAMMERMNRTYSDQMAMAPVGVYDIDLDDFAGMCWDTACRRS
ncbi:hypothetical protein HPB50_021711 [Hyalomma asiaticum]|uniref:Uncharacterized protein n=1 Tax=Hyalomma asiaticum TaxID=266040 RepID=A0ACB7T3W4_HYAAI|nr:hypothetical protein HPB50_021711 [Hyalomma asiaticum]